MTPKWSKNNVYLICMDNGKLVSLIQADAFYEDTKEDVEKQFDTTNERRKK